jgi:hypothetical protein
MLHYDLVSDSLGHAYAVLVSPLSQHGNHTKLSRPEKSDEDIRRDEINTSDPKGPTGTEPKHQSSKQNYSAVKSA